MVYTVTDRRTRAYHWSVNAALINKHCRMSKRTFSSEAIADARRNLWKLWAIVEMPEDKVFGRKTFGYELG